MAESEIHMEQAQSSPLPPGFEMALQKVNEGDQFSDAVGYAARQIGCELLFEVPGILFCANGARTVVVRNRQKPGEGLQQNLMFIVFDGQERIIRVLEEEQVSIAIVELSNSYSMFLEQAAKFIPTENKLLQ